jgi:hypothetical protein
LCSAVQRTSVQPQIPASQSLPQSRDLAAVGSGGWVLGAGRDNFRDSFYSG